MGEIQSAEGSRDEVEEDEDKGTHALGSDSNKLFFCPLKLKKCVRKGIFYIESAYTYLKWMISK